jgi:hypothetical protein
MKNNVLFALCVSIFALLSSCNRTANEPIPTGPVNITIDLNLADYQALIVPGNFVYLEGGVKGMPLKEPVRGNRLVPARKFG